MDIIKIPKGRKKNFEKLINLSDDEFNSLIAAMNKVEPAKTTDELAKKINELSNISYDSIQDIILILIEIYSLHSFKSI